MRFQVETAHPVAVDSYDHLYPRGAVNDNSHNQRFNDALIAVLRKRPAVLDLGCAGGKFVMTLVRDGCPAVGIEGSDRLKTSGGKCWSTLNGHLFTADITKPFTVKTLDGVDYLFDVVTLWEVWEHILEQDIPAVLENITRHLKPGGLMICSVSNHPSMRRADVPDLHRTQKPRQWWVEQFARAGFKERKDIHQRFGGQVVRVGSAFDSTFIYTGGKTWQPVITAR